VLRGGSWKQIDGIDSRSFIRAAFRYPFRPDQQWENHGMRVVLVEG
jgi:formylglycine-generating enzyme required for sulfatase activity